MCLGFLVTWLGVPIRWIGWSDAVSSWSRQSVYHWTLTVSQKCLEVNPIIFHDDKSVLIRRRRDQSELFSSQS